MISAVSEAYSRRAQEYIDLFGTMSAVHPSDRQLVATWAGGIKGQVMDAGCGPGQWTNFLVGLGLDARGVDQVPEFIERARQEYPDVRFEVGTLESLNCGTAAFGGVLSWYSLIHHGPETIRVPLVEFHRALEPGGALLVGFFEGPVVEQFNHAVIPAYRWPVEALTAEFQAAGFDVLESHVRKTAGQRPQAALVARRAEIQ
ncbi:class I SAM-dependent methyltransferase [Agromyces humi]|uniref:class I SAM-dependent methyltransferase n=1 Tax=Agromyces humi TaxID=1766800 RepID=UPI00193A02A0|nr:class I SAM-dependent methyltransferase [Agromyces humi]